MMYKSPVACRHEQEKSAKATLQEVDPRSILLLQHHSASMALRGPF